MSEERRVQIRALKQSLADQDSIDSGSDSGNESGSKSGSSSGTFMDRLMNTRWPCLCCYNDLPEFQKENEWIHNGYRKGWSVFAHLLSVFYPFHNESVNIWTHLIGFVVCAIVMFGVSKDVPRNPRMAFDLIRERATSFEIDKIFKHTNPRALLEPLCRWPVYSFLGGAMVCLGGSAFAHSLNGISRQSNYALWRLDYIGIVALIACSFFPPIYYGFICHPIWRVFYLGTIISIAVSIILMMFHKKFHSERWRMLRVWLFTGMGLSGLVPWLHSFCLHYQTPLAMQAAIQMLMMAASYLGGVVFYAARVPERWLPGKFDFAFNSHQIWHVAVLLGVFNHYKATMSLVAWREIDRSCIF